MHALYMWTCLDILCSAFRLRAWLKWNKCFQPKMTLYTLALFVLSIMLLLWLCSQKFLNRVIHLIPLTWRSVHLCPCVYQFFIIFPRNYESCVVNMVEISKGFDYIKSTAGVLKIFELVSIHSWICFCVTDWTKL